MSVKTEDGEVKEVKITPEMVITYSIAAPNKMLGFFENAESKKVDYIITIMETGDN